MVNNIGAHFAKIKGYEEVLFWNSDLWIHSSEHLEVFFKSHEEYQSKITGAKMLYPTPELSFRGENSIFAKYFDTIQHAGTYMQKSERLPNCYEPNNYGRYCHKNHKLFSINRYDIATTGAMILIDLQHFINLGGFNPSLKINYQDFSLCFNSCKVGEYPLIVCKDCYFYHDESISLGDNAYYGKDKIKDFYLYSKLWDTKEINSILPTGKQIWS